MGKYLIENPRNELQTREWFANHIEEFEYSIIESKSSFPDYVIKNAQGEKLKAEVEFNSSNAITHGHDLNECDMIICWKHDRRLPLSVFELSTKSFYEANAEVMTEREIIEDKNSSATRKVSVSEITTFDESEQDYIKGILLKLEEKQFWSLLKDAVSKSKGYEYEYTIKSFRFNGALKHISLVFSAALEAFDHRRLIIKRLKRRGKVIGHPYDMYEIMASMMMNILGKSKNEVMLDSQKEFMEQFKATDLCGVTFNVEPFKRKQGNGK